jgi:hypothetical protein
MRQESVSRTRKENCLEEKGKRQKMGFSVQENDPKWNNQNTFSDNSSLRAMEALSPIKPRVRITVPHF